MLEYLRESGEETGPWGLLYAMRIRLTGDVIWKDSEFIFLFLCWLFIELLRVKKKMSVSASLKAMVS